MYFNSVSKQKKQNCSKVDKTLRLDSKVCDDKDMKLKTKIKDNTIDKKTINYFTQIFYPQDNLQNSHITTSSHNSIKKEEFTILHEFLHEV